MNSQAHAELVDDTQVRVTRRFAASPQQVFDAHFNPELIQKWMLGPPGWAMPVCRIAPRVGAEIEFQWANSEGESFGLVGVVVELDIPHRSVHTELFKGVPGATETTVETFYRPDGDGTLLEVLITYTSQEAREAAMAAGMVDGMEMSYARIDPLVRT